MKDKIYAIAVVVTSSLRILLGFVLLNPALLACAILDRAIGTLLVKSGRSVEDINECTTDIADALKYNYEYYSRIR
jgi:hypothetical protein